MALHRLEAPAGGGAASQNHAAPASQPHGSSDARLIRHHACDCWRDNRASRSEVLSGVSARAGRGSALHGQKDHPSCFSAALELLHLVGAQLAGAGSGSTATTRHCPSSCSRLLRLADCAASRWAIRMSDKVTNGAPSTWSRLHSGVGGWFAVPAREGRSTRHTSCFHVTRNCSEMLCMSATATSDALLPSRAWSCWCACIMNSDEQAQALASQRGQCVKSWCCAARVEIVTQSRRGVSAKVG